MTGTVRARSSGAPVARVGVTLQDPSGNWIGSGFTDETGAYSITAVPPGVYRAMTWNDAGYLDELYDGLPCPGGPNVCPPFDGTPITVRAGETTSGTDFTLRRGGRITGRLRLQSGTPVTNAAVQAFDAGGAWVRSAGVNESGFYAIEWLPPGSYRLRTFLYAQSTAYLEELYDDIPCPGAECSVLAGKPVEVTSDRTTSGIDFVLRPRSDGRIAGRVTDAATGAPLAGATITARTADGGWGGGTTDAAGAYLITGLEPGAYSVRAYPNRPYVAELYDDIPCVGSSCLSTRGAVVQVSVGQTRQGVDFALSRGGSIAGIVTDAVTGARVTGLFVWLFNAAGEVVDQAFVNIAAWTGDPSVGTFESRGLPPGFYYARTQLYEGDYVDELHENQACPGARCPVTGGTPIRVWPDDVTQVRFALEKGYGVSGYVTDAQSGEPLKDVCVHVHDASGAEVDRQCTGARGTYGCGLLRPGTYHIRTSNASGYLDELHANMPCPSGACSVLAGTPVVVTSSHVRVDLALSTASIRGIVHSATSGAPLPGVRVDILDAGGSTVASARANTWGFYRANGLAPGTYRARTENSSGYTDELYAGVACPFRECSLSAGTPIAVAAWTPSAGIDFGLVPPSATGFHTLAPCRALDSREVSGPFAGVPLGAGEDRALTLAGACGIPATARAVALNVTVTGSSQPGYITLYPRGNSRPVASTVNFRAGQTRAANGIVLLGSQQGLQLFAGQTSGAVHVVLDVTGWFE